MSAFKTSSRHQSSRRLQAIALLAASAAALIACGGGGGDAGSSTVTAAPGTTAASFAAGPITGFGSVIINGIRFDDSTAHVSDDDGVAHEKGELKLGMMATVQSSQILSDDKGQHGQASTIGFRSELVGPVSAVDAVARSLVVLGQPVDVTPATVFDDRLGAGLASIAVGAVVEVYATFDASTGRYSATRIEPKANAAVFKLRGPIASLDTTALTFRIGTALVSYAGVAAATLPALANGTLVRVKLQTTQVAGAWVANEVRAAVQRVEDHAEAEVKGRVTAFTSATQFSVDGLAVDASKATFPNGSTGIVLGARVEIHGAAIAGVIVASKVSVETEDEARHGRFELHGAIDSIDKTAKTLSLRGLNVSYANAAVEFKDGTAADLAAGRQVEVKGALSTDGTTVVATRIEFER